MPAGKRQQSNTVLYTLIIFVAFFIVSTVFAVIFYTKSEDYKANLMSLDNAISDIVTASERNKMSTLIGTRTSGSYMNTLISFNDRATQILLGSPVPSTTEEEKLDKIANNLEGLVQIRKGVSCEDEGALEVLKSIVDKKFNGDFEIVKNNIVIWDYNAVGRYTCKAKIKKVGERKEKKKLPKDTNAAMFAVMNQMFAPAQYGISENGGWINYYTYVTTSSTKENRHLYVEIYSNESDE